MTLKYIDKIGVELEGAWDKNGTIPSGLKNEESIFIKHRCGNIQANPLTCGCKSSEKLSRVKEVPISGDWYEKEAVSPPMKLDSIMEWLKGYYPTVSNKTCGMHVHVSFKSSGSYLKLMDNKFNAYFLDFMDKKGKADKEIGTDFYFERMTGKNKFCTKLFRPAEQVEVTNGANNQIRYSLLNFCWKLHGTLECRMFPMYPNPQIAGKAIVAFIDCVESYLDTVKDFVIKEEFEEDIVVDFPLCAL